MKTLKLLSILCFGAMVALTACNSDGATKAEDTTTVPAATTSTTATPNPAAANEPEVPTGPITSIEFKELEFDYGTIMEGEKVTHDYVFTNTGNEPLIISNAKGSCGCTVPQWPKDPIAPGATGEIKVQFDSKGKGKVGGNSQSKRVTLTANTDPVNTYLTIKGIVDKTEDAAAPAVQ
jgi:hypothetical protein